MSASFDPLFVICSFPDHHSARQIGTVLVEKQLAACVSFLPACRSIYRWQNQITESEETLVFIKSSVAQFPALENLIREHHPYQVPEIIGVPLQQMSPPYREWMEQQIIRGS